MKLVFPSNGFKSLSRSVLSRIVSVSFYSTKTLNPTSKPKRDSLYSRILPASDPRVSIAPILDQWVQEGHSIKDEELISIIKSLKFSKRFNHALEISQWMSKQSNFVVSASSIAGTLDLISRVHGIEQAEEYFDTIPKESLTFPVYLSLLNCYTRWKCIEKAETLVPQVMELGITGLIPVYNGLLNLYSQVGEYGKFESLIEEIKEKGIHPNKFTFSLQLNAYAAISNFDKMDKYLQTMEADTNFSMDWRCYAIAASIYIKADLIDKALLMLKKSEELINGRNAYEHLLTLYAATGRKELHRFWNQLKLSKKLYNTTYKCMISSLLKLDDIAGAEKILEEWESEHKTFDFHVSRLLIDVYCANGYLGKAEILVKKAIEKGKKPFADTWKMLATCYIESDQIPKAVDAIKQGYLARRPGWKPKRETLATCLEYLKEQGDAEKAEEFVRLLELPDHMSLDDCEGLLDYIYNHNGEDSDKVDKIDEDGSDDDETDEVAQDAN